MCHGSAAWLGGDGHGDGTEAEGTEALRSACMGVRPTALFLGALAVGSVVACDPAGWSPFGPAKWLVVGVLSSAAIASGFAAGWARLHPWERRAAAGIAALVTVAAVTGRDGRYAWSGTPERHFGALTWVLVVGCFVAGRGLVDAREWRTVVRSMAVGALVIVAWTVAELVGGPPIALATATRRITGPFGSAAMTGAAALLFGSAAAGLASDRFERRVWRVAGGFGALGCAVALVGSGARAAWFGAAVAAALVVRRRMIVPLLVAFGVAALVLLPRLGDVVDRSHGAGSRVDEWRVAVRVIARHPVLGVGPEGYRLAFAEGVDDRYEQRYGRAVLPDRAHSAPLDVAVTLGVPGGLGWLAAVGAVGWRLRRVARRAPPLAAGLAGGVLAYLVQQLLFFPLAELDPLAWGLAGVLVGMAAIGAPSPGVNEPAREQRRAVRLVGRATAAVGALGAVVALLAGIRELAADRVARSAAEAITAGPSAADRAIERSHRAVELRGDVLRYHLLVARAEERSGTLAGVDRAIGATVAAAAISPDDPIVLGERARLLSQRAEITGLGADLQRALGAWTALVGDDPHRAGWQLGLGIAAADSGDTDTAEHALERAAALAPADPTAARLLARLHELGGGG